MGNISKNPADVNNQIQFETVICQKGLGIKKHKNILKQEFLKSIMKIHQKFYK